MNSAAITVLAEAGIDGIEAEAILRCILAKLAAPSPQALEAMQEMEVEAEALDPSLHSVVDIVRILADAGLDLDWAHRIFGNRGAWAMAALTNRIDRLEAVLMPDTVPIATVRLMRVIFPVSDIEQATDFYRKLLRNEGQRLSPGQHAFDFDGVSLVCYDPRADEDGFEARPNQGYCSLCVADVDAFYRRVQVLDWWQLDAEVETRDSGERGFFGIDPFGNPLNFIDVRTTVSCKAMGTEEAVEDAQLEPAKRIGNSAAE